MTEITLDIRKYDWTVRCYIDSVPSDCDCICRELSRIGCSGEALKGAREHLSREMYNIGLTYSNARDRVTIMAIGKAESEEERLNTTAHESLHAVSHISGECGISMNEEEPCYLLGWIVMRCYFALRKQNKRTKIPQNA